MLELLVELGFFGLGKVVPIRGLGRTPGMSAIHMPRSPY